MLGCKLGNRSVPWEIANEIRRCALIKNIMPTWSFIRFALIILLLSAVNSAAQDQPTIAKDSVQVTAFTLSSYKGSFKTFSWVPRLNLRVNGPIASGSQIYAEFSAGSGPWVKFDCKTEEIQAGRWWQTECGGREGIAED